MTKKKDEKQVVELASETMLGDLKKMVVDELRAQRDHWSKLSESDQEVALERIEKRLREAIKLAIHMIASHGFTRLGAKIESLTLKNGIKATLAISSHEAARHELFDANGSYCTVVLADVEQFGGGAAAVKADKQQPDLPLVIVSGSGGGGDPPKLHKPKRDRSKYNEERRAKRAAAKAS